MELSRIRPLISVPIPFDSIPFHSTRFPVIAVDCRLPACDCGGGAPATDCKCNCPNCGGPGPGCELPSCDCCGGGGGGDCPKPSLPDCTCDCLPNCSGLGDCCATL